MIDFISLKNWLQYPVIPLDLICFNVVVMTAIPLWEESLVLSLASHILSFAFKLPNSSSNGVSSEIKWKKIDLIYFPVFQILNYYL